MMHNNLDCQQFFSWEAAINTTLTMKVYTFRNGVTQACKEQVQV